MVPYSDGMEARAPVMGEMRINAEGPDTKENQAEEVLNNAEDCSRKTFAENWLLSKIRENKIDMKQAQDIDSFRLPVLPNVVKCFTSSSLCLNVNSVIADARQGDTMHHFLDEMILDFPANKTVEQTCPLAGNSVHLEQRFISKYVPRPGISSYYQIVNVSTIKEKLMNIIPFIARLSTDLFIFTVSLKINSVGMWSDACRTSEQQALHRHRGSLCLLPMAHAGSTKVYSWVPGIERDKGGAQAFLQCLVMLTVFAVLERQGRSALLPDAVILAILSQLALNVAYEPLPCENVALNLATDMSWVSY
ncbi:hypothetical protein KIN20_031849 [Parelaphostrongylus tenuis]|uniref:Uncharacterized protein n=1 Tax=Parelaphostrongylus tenuis TaxID=148309 RepID=A0AAD5R621_PARTN|nr:hypothetical protein KIN20_031849 [Parelaphostrongylus tenuis]